MFPVLRLLQYVFPVESSLAAGEKSKAPASGVSRQQVRGELLRGYAYLGLDAQLNGLI